MTSRSRRPLALGFAALGMLSLAGCAVQTAVAGTAGDNSTGAPDSAATSGYADGTYTVEAGYQAPSGDESIVVELTLVDDTVTAVTVSGDATDHEAREWQGRFASAISGEIVGKDISALSVSRVAGASLTANGFNSALDEIRSQAA
ncbi:MAG: hypothetical protein ABIQ01_02945 [Pseudolysinimonas sp.]